MTPHRRVQYVLVCEDQQHEVFGLRFIKRMGLVTDNRQVRVERSLAGIGAGDQFTRDTYVTELEAGRKIHIDRTLLVLVDGDNYGFQKRLRQMDEACRQRGVEPRSSADQVAIFVPTWNIETWIAYLGGEGVDEGVKNYPKLARTSDCQPCVNELAEMCRRRELREPAPASLLAACREYDNRFG